MTPMELYSELLELLILYHKYKQKKRCRRGNSEIFKSREHHAFFRAGVQILKNANPELFYKSTRMYYQQFEVLLNLLHSYLEKTSKRKAIEPEQRLYITIYFLAQGCTMHTISMKFRIGLETARSIIFETCDLLWKKLGKLYVPPPREKDWEDIALNFEKSTGLPNCIGVLDGKHIRISTPAKSHRYKRDNSIVLLSTCDSNYAFTLVDVVVYDPQSDSGVLRSSGFGQKFLANELDVPRANYLPGTTEKFPYYMVASAAFPLKTNIMTPYGKPTNIEKEKYNAIISRARNRIETAFDILTTKWRVLKKSIGMSPRNARKVVLATIVLHNHLRLSAIEQDDCSLNDATTFCSIDRAMLHTSNAASQSALNLRNILAAYISANL